MTDDYYCSDDKYVWRCRNNENCNSVYPLQNMGWLMWETWELIDAVPVRQGQNGATMEELMIKM